MKEIKLGRSGKVALVDDADFAELNSVKWCCTGGGYAHRALGGGKYELMHRRLAGAQKGQQVDHRNRNKLDNQRQNLRIASPAQNRQNSGPNGGRLFKGVVWDRSTGKWVAQIGSRKLAQRMVHLGSFDTAHGRGSGL